MTETWSPESQTVSWNSCCSCQASMKSLFANYSLFDWGPQGYLSSKHRPLYFNETSHSSISWTDGGLSGPILKISSAHVRSPWHVNLRCVALPFLPRNISHGK